MILISFSKLINCNQR